MLTRRLIVALAGCVVLAGLNPVLYRTPWWEAMLAGAVAVGLLAGARILLAGYRRSLDDEVSYSRPIRARAVAIFLVGQAAGPAAALPLALEVGFATAASAVVLGVVGLYAVSRLLLVAFVWSRQRRVDRADSQVVARRRAGLEGERGIFHFGEVVLWALLLFTAWGSLLTPVPLAAALFIAGWYSMMAAYVYFVRLL